nr:hypothetical protein [Leptospira santarosai]
MYIYTKTLDRQRKEELMAHGVPDCFLIDLNDLQRIIQKALKIMKTFEHLASNESAKITLSLKECEGIREEILSLFFSRGKDKYALKFSFENIVIL